jgi:hypothetical protein
MAEFLGITCEPLLLDPHCQPHPECIEGAIPGHDDCLLMNPRVIREWLGRDDIPPELFSCLTARFPHLLVHGLGADASSEALVRTLSNGGLTGVQRIPDASQPYAIASDLPDICGAFSGISFGPVDPANDCTFALHTSNGEVRAPISIGGRPFMALTQRENSEILFLASADTLDVNEEVGSAPLSKYFSRFIPQAMALRYIFGEQCWRPSEHHAAVTIDDPLLQPRYGYLKFESLLRLMQEHDFSGTIAFIPHNYRRSSKRIVQMFRENRDRLAICFHGNDHTGAELASTDPTHLNTLLSLAEARMGLHQRATGLSCGRVMVFPQGHFSVEAMRVLKSHNFCAGVNTTPHPTDDPVELTAGELAQPAILRYGGFPLFLRKPIRQTTRQDIAFNLFFGRPVLIVEHHDVFKRPETLAEAVSTVNSVAPGIRWSDLESAVTSSFLRRRTADGTCHVRAYAGSVRLSNHQDLPQQYSVRWRHSDGDPSVENLLADGVPSPAYAVDNCGIRLSTELAPGQSRLFSVTYHNEYRSHEGLGFRWNLKAFVRRRLSEVRDNYLSKNELAMGLAKALQRALLSRGHRPNSAYE